MSDNEDGPETYEIDRHGGSPGQSSSSSSKEKGKQKASNSIKKRKLNRACDACRKRKVRCDFVELPSGSLEKCLNCFSAQVSCTFSEESKPRESTKSQIRALEARLKRAEQLAQLLCPDPEKREALLNGTIDALPPPTPSVHSSPGKHSDSEKPPRPGNDGWSLRQASSEHVRPLEEDLCRMVSISEPGKSKTCGVSSMYFIGESSEGALVMKTIRMKQQWEVGNKKLHREENERDATITGFGGVRREFWSPPPWEHDDDFLDGQVVPDFSYPPQPLMDELISLYFKHVNVDFPLIHRARFEQDLRNGLHRTNGSFAMNILLVCAIGARYSDDPAVLLSEEEFEESITNVRDQRDAEHLRSRWRKTSHFSRGWRYFSQVLTEGHSKRHVHIGTSIHEALCIPLAAIYIRYTSMANAAWCIVGVGMRVLQNVGAHRDRRHDSSDLDFNEQEQLRRIWWVLVCLDRCIACELGRPLSIHSEDLDQVLPVECDDEYWDNPDPDLRFKQPAGKLSLITGFNLHVQLTEILGTVIRTIYTTKSLIRFLHVERSDWDERVVAGIDSRLNRWLGSIPPELQWQPNSPDSPFFAQSAKLHIMYHYVVIVLHWPFLVSPSRSKGVNFPSVTICNNSARSIARIGQALLQRTGEVPNELLHPIFVAGVVLLMKTWSVGHTASQAAQKKRDMEDAIQCSELLKAAEKRSYKAGRAYDIFQGLSTKSSDISRSSPVGSGPTLPQKPANGEKWPTSPSDPGSYLIPAEELLKMGEVMFAHLHSARAAMANGGVTSSQPSSMFNGSPDGPSVSTPTPSSAQGMDYLSGPSAAAEPDWTSMWQMISDESTMSQSDDVLLPFTFDGTQGMSFPFGQPPFGDHQMSFGSNPTPRNSHRAQGSAEFGIDPGAQNHSLANGSLSDHSGSSGIRPLHTHANANLSWTSGVSPGYGVNMDPRPFPELIPMLWDEPVPPYHNRGFASS